MKSRTSSFNTALRKNMTRFAPCWVLCAIGLVMIVLLMAQDSDYRFARNLADLIMIMAVINLGYALLTAQLLFGDLFNSRMCNALHAMPLRREGWYAANVIAGLLFSLIPTLIAALVALPFCCASPDVVNGWQIPLYWLLGSNLSYICFFGIAVLCMQLTGNRFAMVVVYAILNFAAIIAYWLVDTLYTPMLYGVQTLPDPFLRLTPVYHMVDTEYVDVTRYNQYLPSYYVDFTVTDSWSRLIIWAVVGIVLLALSLLLYRKRRLECAGDFMAFKSMEPIFLVSYTLIAATCIQFFATNIVGSYSEYLYLFIGIALGWFTGQMMLKRTIRVFRWKTIGVCALMMVLMGVSLILTALDVFGIAGWMPELSEVDTAYVYMGYSYTEKIPGSAVVLSEQDDIASVLRIHELALEREYIADDQVNVAQTTDGEYVYGYTDTGFAFTLIYKLKDGRTVRRYYVGYAAGEIGEIMTPWFSDIQVVLGITEAELDTFAASVFEAMLDGNTGPLTDDQIRELLDAIAADCREGHMVQLWAFHVLEDSWDTRFYVELGYTTQNQPSQWRNVTIFPCCENTIRWMDDNDMWLYTYEYQEKYNSYYD